MNKVLVIQGAGMDMRGQAQVEIFGPETIDEINALIKNHAEGLSMEVEIMQSNDEAAVVERLGSIDPADIVAVLINPAGFTTTTGPLPDAVSQLAIPVYEIHASNPAARDVKSTILPACKGAICGFG
ncbi:MAG: type II 3-dehydroquinate dehydratase, partial [bacterium]